MATLAEIQSRGAVQRGVLTYDVEGNGIISGAPELGFVRAADGLPSGISVWFVADADGVEIVGAASKQIQFSPADVVLQ
jgi:hypothetical protein